MSSRVRDMVLSLALCHNVSSHSFGLFVFGKGTRPNHIFFLGDSREQRRWHCDLPGILA